MNEAEPTLAELIRRALASRLADVHVSMPGIVVDYDSARKTATIQPGLRRVILDENDDRVEEEIPPIKNVPVAFFGGSALSVHFNLQAGDTGTLLVPTNSTNEFQGTARTGAPGSLKLHDLGSAVFFPHPYQANALPDTDESIGIPGGLRAHFGVSSIDIGNGTQAVVLETLLTAVFTALKAAIAAAAVTEAGNVVPGTFGMTALAANLASWPTTPIGASNLKADP